MKKLSAYQKLKQEILKLHRRLITLVMQPESREALQIKAVVKMQCDLEKEVFAGDPTITCSTGFEGILNQLT